jgi:transcriptional regulator with XRE-family HTH domain
VYPNLKLEIFKRGMRQNQLARLLGINEAILSKIINGYREPSDGQRKLLAEFLQVNERWLFEKYDSAGNRILSDAARQQATDGGNS